MDILIAARQAACLFMTIRLFGAAALLVIGSACAPVQVVTGTVRPRVAVSAVIVYSAAPPRFEQIALLAASSKTLFKVGGQHTIDKLVSRLVAQAAKLGANGLILDGFDDERSTSLGTGVGSNSYTHNGDISLGLGASIGVFTKTGNARAIYVPH